MTTSLQRLFSILRTWLGLGDAADAHPTPSHGWLLPPPDVLRMRKPVVASDAPVPAERPIP